jgi:CubicO group peptidase (beta-lactamase class C family)
MDKYWSDPDLANDDRRKLLTPRIALSHRTGFANWRRQTNGVLTIQHDPGTVVGYSGEGFQYLARFTVNKTGTPLDQLAQTLIFNPAGMHDTSFTRQPWFEGRIAVPTDAQGKSLPPQFADKPSAADLVYTTPSDYAKFIISILNHTAVTPAVFAERSRIQFSEKDKMCAGDKASTCPDDVGFGLSWQVARFGDDAYLMHTGNDEGVTTLAYINLATRSATIVFTNSANGGKIYMPVLESIGKDPVFLNYLRAQAR